MLQLIYNIYYIRVIKYITNIPLQIAVAKKDQ